MNGMSSTDEPDRTAVTGVVLAGGLGRRMSADGSGTDKALVPLAGRPMIAHVIERFAPQVQSLMINANGDGAARLAILGLPVVGDRIGGFIGPLAGIHAALAATRTPLLATVPCDAPRLPRDLVARLHAALLRTDRALAVASRDGRLQPVFALMRVERMAELERQLAQGMRRVGEWARAAGAIAVSFDAATNPPDAFRNINTPADLAELDR